VTTLPAEIGATALATRTVIDVRTPAEYAAGHVPGSYNVPLDRVGEALPALREVAGQREVALICATGSRSLNASAQLAKAGVTAPSVTGGLAVWPGELARADGARPRATWAMDRQVRLAAGSLVLLGVVLDFFLPGARYLSAAIGAGLVFSAVTNTCGMAVVLSRLPYNRPRGAGDELRRTMERLREAGGDPRSA
jgi:rhodanese-related sulfurtransferase